jgi:hypothetical protein
MTADVRLRQRGQWDRPGYEDIFRKTIVYLNSTLFQLLFFLQSEPPQFCLKNKKSKMAFMKKIHSPQKLFKKHNDEMRYEM